MVQRHDFLVVRCDEEDGEYVAYTDFAALEQRFDALSSKFAAMVEENAALESILRRIINDLPTNRDWLDPELEKAARDILKGEGDEMS